MARIHLYLFDMGGVVSVNNDVISRVAARLDLTPEQFYERAGEDALLLMPGKLAPAEFWERISAVTGRAVNEDLFARYFHPVLDREVAGLVEELRKHHRVVVGTNTIETHYRIHRELGHYDLFDAVYASHLMGLVKPDPRFYREVLESEHRDPSETAFIDDLPENVDSARRLGIHAILFTGAADLENEIRRLG